MGCAPSHPEGPPPWSFGKQQSSASQSEQRTAEQGQEQNQDGGCYKGAPCPLNEAIRLQHLKELGILDTGPEKRFDNITKICCTIFKVPIALVSLVDADRQWFKSEQGLDGARQTDRASSFCAWTLLPQYPEALVVEDTELDARFKANPLVKGFPFIRFYAGCPLVASNGLRLGSLCIIDRAPRLFDAESCALLANMAEMVVREIEMSAMVTNQRQASQEVQAPNATQDARQPLAPSNHHLLRGMECLREAVMLVATSGSGDWTIAYANEACQQLLGGGDPITQASFWSLFRVIDARGRAATSAAAAGSSVQLAYARAIREKRNFELRVAYVRRGGDAAAGDGSGGPAQQQQQQQQQQQHNGINRTSSGGGSGAAATPASGGGGSGALMSGILQFRFAQHTGIDQHMPLIGIPNFLPSSPEPPQFYFATLRETGPAPRPIARLSADGGVTTTASGPMVAAAVAALSSPPPVQPGHVAAIASAFSVPSGPGGGFGSDESTAPNSGATLMPASSGSLLMGRAPSVGGSLGPGATGNAFYHLLPNNDVFEDIRLGALLGRGSFGRVYRATWNGGPVAVKIIEYVDEEDEGSNGGNRRGNGGAPNGVGAPGSGTGSETMSPLAAAAQRRGSTVSSEEAMATADGFMAGAGAAAAAAAPGEDTSKSDANFARHPRAVLEGLLQERISHPNIVKNFKFFVRVAPQDTGSDGEEEDAPYTGPAYLAYGDGPGDASGEASVTTITPAPRRDGPVALPRPPRKRMMEAWLVLEFCNRGCIADAIEKGWFRQRRSAFEPCVRAIVTTAREVAGAMAYLHSQGILHGDLTGNNVLLTSPRDAGLVGDPRGFVAKVSDFGLSRSVADDGFVSTRTYGTVTHMPVEVLMEGRLSKAADVYSFGVLLWEMFQGHRPFAGLTHSQVLHAVSTGRTLGVPRHAPEEIKPLLARCLDPRAQTRPRFTEVHEALLQLEGLFEW